jgi:hypothetical protein
VFLKPLAIVMQVKVSEKRQRLRSETGEVMGRHFVDFVI